MPTVMTKQETLDQLVREAKKLNKFDLQMLLTRTRVKKLAHDRRKPVASYNPEAVPPPTIAEINDWIHEARKEKHESKKVRARQ